MTMTNFGELRRGVFPAMQRRTFADATTQPFWSAAKENRLVVPRCANCGTFRMPPYALCFRCQSWDAEWVELPGTGTVYSYTVVHHPLHPTFSAIVPYVSGVVELDGTQGEGARMLVNIVDCDPDDISIGTRVEAVYDHVNDEFTQVRFRPIDREDD
jgi:uncharacterized protein